MKHIFSKKILYFVLLTMFFALISFFFRELLIYKFNNVNFKLFQIDYIKNYGAAFSLFYNYTTCLIVISIIILCFALTYIFSNISLFSRRDFVFSAMLIAGILCNLIERISDGYVTDYIRLNYITFPIFNISDIFICAGAFVLICNILFESEKND